MKVSLNIVKTLLNFELPPVDELVARINAQLGRVEEIIDLGAKYGGARIVRVMECAKHPDADRLSVTKIDDGGMVDVPRDENGLVQVVCGAPNVHADMWAIWLPPKSTVPASFDDDEPFVLDARKLRGVLSQGMLAAGDELGLNDDHEGIIEITERDMPSGVELKPGLSFAKIFGLDDVVIDIENKMFTHRPDCFGQLGVAREVAGIFGQQFTSPDWYKTVQEFADASGLELQVFNDAPKLVPRFMAVAIKNVEVKPSPLWLQCQLVAMGGKPINNIVDATNYVMFMTAQPTHAYDYDKLRGGRLGARMACDGETVALLDGKTYELTADDVVIADGEGVIGLAGIMGGSDSEVSDMTKNVVLECANFDMYTLRKTAMRHGIFTDALTRFNKGQSPLQNAAVLKWLMGMVGGEQASEVFDVRNDKLQVTQHDPRVTFGDKSQKSISVFDWESTTGVIVIENTFVNQRLGTDFSPTDICGMLRNTEIKAWPEPTSDTPNLFEVIPPFWRTDLELPEDIVEEVGRLYGFDKLPRELPQRSALAAPKNPRREVKQAIRESLSRAGANEVLTYSFVHENVLKKAEQDAEQAFKLSNALSPDLQYYRLTVLPSLLDKVHANIKAGHDEFALFEIGKGHNKQLPTNDPDNLPRENHFTDLVYAAKKPGDGAPFYLARRLVEQLGHDLGAAFSFAPIDEKSAEILNSSFHTNIIAPFDPERTAMVMAPGKTCVGLVGELKQSVIKGFKLPSYVAAATLETAVLDKLYQKRSNAYQSLSRFPSISQDITLRTRVDVSYSMLYTEMEQVIRRIRGDNDGKYADLTITIAPRSVYQPAPNDPHKSTTFRLTFTDYSKTLSGNEVAQIIDARFVQALRESCGAERV